MKLDNVQIEKLSVALLQQRLLCSNQLSPFIDENDKTPLWDGDIFVYKSNGIKVKNLIGRVAVQVKGTQKKDLSKQKISFPVRVSNLQKYLDDGGVIYFVVALRTSEIYTIYYKVLLPFDLTKLLNSNKKNQDSIVIEMKQFPKDDNEIVDIFYNFLNDRKKQASTVDRKYLSMEDVITNKLDVEKFSFGYSGISLKDESPIQYSLRHPTYIYAKPRGFDIQIPIDVVEFIEAKTEVNNVITINNEIYYDKYDVVFLKDSTELHIGKSFIFNIRTGILKFQIKGYLKERIKDMYFLIALMKGNEIQINGITISNFDIHSEDPVSVYEEHVQSLLRIKDTLEVLEIKEDLNWDILTNDERNNLDLLSRAILDDEALSINPKIINTNAVANLEIANLYMKLIFTKNDKGLYNIYNYFGTKEIDVHFELNDKTYKSSQYILLKKEDFTRLSNINYLRISESIFNVNPTSKDYYSQVILLTLEMIKAYDELEIKDKNILETALNLTDWIIENDESLSTICLLNKFQIIKRMRDLTDEELLILLNIKQNETDHAILTGACILLESYVEAKMFYEKLSDEIKKEFELYPICNLWKKQIN